MKRKRNIPFKLLLAAAVLCGCLLADSNLRPVTTEYELSFAALPAAFDGFRVVQLSDVHGAVFGAGNARLLAGVRDAAPDIIVITGDFADKDSDIEVLDELLAGLAEIAPVYYVSGNHEWSEGMIEPLRGLFQTRGIRYLRNEYVTLERGGERIVLAGVEDPNGWADQPKPDEVVAALRRDWPDAFVLLLGHRNYWVREYPALPVDLILCGHAHGGVVRLPFVGGLLGQGRVWFPEYTEGVYESGYQMVVSRGIGNSGGLLRFGNNPEIVAVTLRAR